MDWMTPIYLLAALLLVLLNAFFVLAEFALVKVRATRIEELVRQGSRRALVTREMITHLDNYLSATQLGITVASLGLGWLGKPAFAGLIEAVIALPGWWSDAASYTVSLTVSFLIITFLHIVVGELAPKSMAIRSSEQCALAIAYPMRWAYRLFYPPMLILNGASNLLLRLIGLRVAQAEVAHTEQELRILLSTAETSSSFSLNRLLMLENIFDLGNQTVKDAMIPWSRVRYLSRSATRDQVMPLLAEHRFSRWPVLDPDTGAPIGYLLMKDFIVPSPEKTAWTRLIRPLRAVSPRDSLELTMQALQQDGANMAIVLDGSRPLGLITLEDILEEIVGRIEDEYARLPKLYLKDALVAGGVVLDLTAGTPEEAIRSLAAAIPAENLPRGVDVAALAWAGEHPMSTDIGQGVALPHARCPGLARPLMVLGRSIDGIRFSAKFAEPVRLVFLLVTPAEPPSLQVFLLAQLASVARSEFIRERLCRAHSAQQLVEIIAAADPAVGHEGRPLPREEKEAQLASAVPWEDRWRDDGGQG
jgi:CBS domain containing-hemolysin-like protein/mannitol/fructose-specific phosphotransferase system IIA component (Ntr-type)